MNIEYRVVGDGEISFGGGQDVTDLMNALEGAAVNTAAANNADTNGAAENKSIQALDTTSDPTSIKGTVVSQGSATAVTVAATTTAAAAAAVHTGLHEQGS